MDIASPRNVAPVVPILTVLVIGIATGCNDGPTAPTRFSGPRPPADAVPPTPPPRMVEITGQLWQHDASGMHIGTGYVSGFVFAPRMGFGMPATLVAPDGSYRAQVPADSLVYLTTTVGHQPCLTAVSTAGVSEVRGIDLHVVTDPTRLGASLPPELLQRPNRVTGVVFEPQPDGSRVPIAGVWVGLDGAFGDGLVIAGTLTDADGRYIVCGVTTAVGPGVGVTLFAGLEPYRPFFIALDGTTDAVIDIPLSR